MSRQWFVVLTLLIVSSFLVGACAQPTPEVKVVTKEVERVVTKEVEKIVKETVVITKEVEKVVVATPTPISQTKSEVVTVNWWATEKGRDTAATREMHFQLARAFEKKHPNIKVALSLFPSRGFGTRVATAIAAGQGPDVWYHYYAPEIADLGFLEDLTPYMEQDGITPEELWFPIGRIRARFKGHYYGVPRDATAGFIVYNKDIFDAAGVSYPESGWTFEDFRQKALALTDSDKGVWGAGAIIGSMGGLEWSPFSFNLGADFVSPDGHQVVGYMDTPEAIHAFKIFMDLTREDKVTAPAGLQQQFGELVFLSGKIAMQSVSTWEIPALTEKANFNWGVVEPPRFNESSNGIPWTDAYVYYVWSGSKVKDAAWELVKFLSGPEAAEIIAESRVWTPNSPQIWKETGLDKDPVWGVAWKELQKPNAKVPNYLRSRYQWDCIQPAFDNIWTRYVVNGENDLESIVKEETVKAQKCLDENYGAQK